MILEAVKFCGWYGKKAEKPNLSAAKKLKDRKSEMKQFVCFVSFAVFSAVCSPKSAVRSPSSVHCPPSSVVRRPPSDFSFPDFSFLLSGVQLCPCRSVSIRAHPWLKNAETLPGEVNMPE